MHYSPVCLSFSISEQTSWGQESCYINWKVCLSFILKKMYLLKNYNTAYWDAGEWDDGMTWGDIRGEDDQEQQIHGYGHKLTQGHTSVNWKGRQNCLYHLRCSLFQSFSLTSLFPHIVLLFFFLLSSCSWVVVGFLQLYSCVNFFMMESQFTFMSPTVVEPCFFMKRIKLIEWMNTAKSALGDSEQEVM